MPSKAQDHASDRDHRDHGHGHAHDDDDDGHDHDHEHAQSDDQDQDQDHDHEHEHEHAQGDDHDHDHRHSHGHGHGHHHHHGHGRAFAISVTLNVAFVAVEVFYGLLAGSTSLVADAVHNLGDVLGLGLAWGAMRLATVRPSDARTYGFRKSTVLAALINAILIVLAVGAVAWEAVGRIGSDAHVDGPTMVVVAAIGVVVNGASAAMFFAGRKQDANIRGAFLHLAADAAVSVGVVVAGLFVLTLGWTWVDPVASLVIAVVIVIGTWGLLRESVDLLMDAVPSHIDVAQVRACLASVAGVTEVHDLHVWAMSTSELSLTVHLAVADGVDPATVLACVQSELETRFAISHTTVQIEAAHHTQHCGQGRAGTL